MTMMRSYDGKVFLVRLLSFSVIIICCQSYIIESNQWRYKGHPISYDRATRVDDDDDGVRLSSPWLKAPDEAAQLPLLLLNGFGVGSFHQHRLMGELVKNGKHANRRIYAIDYLGQGRSWPEGCADGQSANERGLRYCAMTWIDQITQFIHEVILPENPTANGQVHVVGNSVGGYLSVFVAALSPDVVASLVLINATPIWGLNLPGWSGHLPPPSLPRWVGRYAFDTMRDRRNIERFLTECYANRAAFDDTLIQQIRACTDGPGGHAAFSSILWSPPAAIQRRLNDNNNNDDVGTTRTSELKFYDCLELLSCDVLLIFGRDDPWCTPALAKNMLQRLLKRSQATATPPTVQQQRYVELSNVGHCPNHEAPTAVARLLDLWLDAPRRDSPNLELVPSNMECVTESWGVTRVQERKMDEIQLTLSQEITRAFF